MLKLDEASHQTDPQHLDTNPFLFNMHVVHYSIHVQTIYRILRYVTVHLLVDSNAVSATSALDGSRMDRGHSRPWLAQSNDQGKSFANQHNAFFWQSNRNFTLFVRLNHL